MVRSFKDERIAALESKVCGANMVKTLIKKIMNQKLNFAGAFMGKPYLDNSFKNDVAFMKSFSLPSESDVKTQKDGEYLLNLSFRVNAILVKCYKARQAYNTTAATKDSASQTDCTPEIQNWLQSSFKAQKQTIQKLENEIKSLRKGSTSQTQEIQTIDNSDEWETVATTESSTTEPISRELMRDLIVKIHKLKSKLLAKEFKALKKTYEADFDYIVLLDLPKAKLVELNEVEWKKLLAIDKKLEAIMSKFVNSTSPENPLDKNNDLSIQPTLSRDQYTDTKDLVSPANKHEIDGIQLLHNEIFSQLESKVKSTLNLEIATAIKKSTESFKNLSVTCSECSKFVARIGELERKLVEKDVLVSAESKRISEMETCFNKKVSDGQSKISSLNAELQKMEGQITEADRELRYETLNKNLALKRVADLEIKMGTELYDKESEISKLKTKVENQAKLYSQQQKSFEACRKDWNRTYQNGCRQVEFLQADNRRLIEQNNHLEMRFRSVCVDASQMENELRITRTTATTARRHQQEANKLKNQLAEEKKKTKDLVACDKPNSEYEMLLSEKDAIIAEYVSVLDSKYLTIDIVDKCW